MFAGMSASADGRPSGSFSTPFFPSAGGGNSAGSTASKTQASATKKKRKKHR